MDSETEICARVLIKIVKYFVFLILISPEFFTHFGPVFPPLRFVLSLFTSFFRWVSVFPPSRIFRRQLFRNVPLSFFQRSKKEKPGARICHHSLSWPSFAKPGYLSARIYGLKILARLKNQILARKYVGMTPTTAERKPKIPFDTSMPDKTLWRSLKIAHDSLSFLGALRFKLPGRKSEDA